MRIYRQEIYRRICALTASLAIILGIMTTGCSSPDIDNSLTTEESEALQLHLAIETGGYTRDGSMVDKVSEERRIDDVLVMLFRPGTDGMPSTLWKARKADRLGPDGGEGKPRYFDVHFSMTDETDIPLKLSVVTIANAGAFESEVDGMRGKDYGVIQNAERLWQREDERKKSMEDDTSPLFTMWGISPDIIETHTRVQNIRMGVIRDMAKVTVRLTKNQDDNISVSGDSEFKIAHALVYNRRSEVAMMPALSTVSLDEGLNAYTAFKPTLWKGADGKTDAENLVKDEDYDTPLSPLGSKEISIYIPEQDVLMGGYGKMDDGNEFNRPALIVGGYYNGDVNKIVWYRVDFTSERDKDGKLILGNILRNHHYRVSVTAVNGPGEDTPEKAYHSYLTKMESDVIDWEEKDWDAEFDGSNWIAAQREVTVGGKDGDMTSIVLRSNVPSESWSFSWDKEGIFEANVVKIIPDNSENPDDSSDKDIEEVESDSEISDDEEQTIVLIKALGDMPEDLDFRSARLTVTVTSRLKFVINVNQEKRNDDSMHDEWGEDGFTIII